MLAGWLALRGHLACRLQRIDDLLPHFFGDLCHQIGIKLAGGTRLVEGIVDGLVDGLALLRALRAVPR